ncbi:MAG: hypothetical protein IJ493_05200 [Clostridia bacterium]|nr:hypothetical protein [Clostridia bacterium]
MNKRYKRFVSILLLAALLLAGCGSEASDTKANDTNATDVTDTTAETMQQDNLPSGLDFGGETVSVYVRGDNVNTEFDAEESGDIVDDAIYKRNRAVEERLNVKLSYFANTTEDAWGERDKYMNTIRGSVMSDDGSIDLVGSSSVYNPIMAREGLFFNLLVDDMPYLDFMQPWWSESLINEMAVDGRLYTASGDASLGLIKGMMCFYFNKELTEAFQIPDLYETVQSGQWTLGKMHEYVTLAYHDLNGNTKADEEDRLGLIIDNQNYGTNFYTSCGLKMIDKNEEGIPFIAVGSERVVEVLDRLAGMFVQPGYSVGMDETELTQTFLEGRALFYAGEFASTEKFREVEFDFGVIPFPKYDEEQEEYLTAARNTYTGFSIPVTADKEMVAAVLEAMGSESWRTVSPAYYEQALKVKYSRDDVSSQMYDLIRSGIVFDYGLAHNLVLDNLSVNLRVQIVGALGTWTSVYASKKTQWETLLEEYLADIAELEE